MMIIMLIKNILNKISCYPKYIYNTNDKIRLREDTNNIFYKALLM